MPLRKVLNEQPTRSLFNEVALKRRHALVLRRIREVVPGVERCSESGVGGIQLQYLRNGCTRRIGVEVRVDVLQEFLICTVAGDVSRCYVDVRVTARTSD